ncbi:MAG: hypothetical protein QXH51_06480 [Candidatus Bathyarchaeia archaeon]
MCSPTWAHLTIVTDPGFSRLTSGLVETVLAGVLKLHPSIH